MKHWADELCAALNPSPPKDSVTVEHFTKVWNISPDQARRRLKPQIGKTINSAKFGKAAYYWPLKKKK